ncbi:MAG: hypothetical protein GX129_10695 [Clostridiales bacterium]|jgi:hypothetical protein|nr:hypothetical protein [Clostridiales bacterium]
MKKRIVSLLLVMTSILAVFSTSPVLDQINPIKWFYDYGHDVLYPYIWKPLKSLFN